jgi:hypothetical protein
MSRFVFLFIVLLSVPMAFADCIPWVGGAQTYTTGDCVTLDGKTYYALRDVNAWTHPYDTWHWSTVAPVITIPVTQGSVVVDLLAVNANRSIQIPNFPGTKTFPMSEQSYTVDKDGLLLVDATLLVAQLSAGEGTYHIDMILNGTTTSRFGYYMVEIYSQGGHYREANVRNQIEVKSGDQVTVKTWVSNTWVSAGEYGNGTAVTVENANVLFYEGGKLLSATTSLKRQ